MNKELEKETGDEQRIYKVQYSYSMTVASSLHLQFHPYRNKTAL